MDATPDDLSTQRTRLMEELRGYGAAFTEVSRRFAAWSKLHYTDAIDRRASCRERVFRPV